MKESHKKYSVCKGNSVTLICGTGLEGNPKPIVTWIPPQTESGESRYVKTEDPAITLNITKNDGGTWKCIVEVDSNDSVACPDPNTSSRTRYVEMEVTVIVPPSEPLQLSVTEGDKANILISWERPMQRGPPAQTVYKICFNGTCYTDVEVESIEVSAAHFEQNDCYRGTVYAVSKGDGEPVKCPYGEHAWIVADYPRNLTISDIGYDWVYFNWSGLALTCGHSQWNYSITCSNESTSFTITTPHTVQNITNLLSNATYNCRVVAFSGNKAASFSHPPVSFIPGSGTVIEVPNNHVIIARFTDELNSMVLNCTVQQGDIRTDTVWNAAGYSGVSRFIIFGDGDRPSSNLDSIHGNHMHITAEVMSEFDGVSISCGSHEYPHQATFEFHIKSIPKQTVADMIMLWEGTTDCTIETSNYSLEACNITETKWLKGGRDISRYVPKNDFEITFVEVKREDARTYHEEFELTCFEGIDSRQFTFSFTIDVLYGPTMNEGQKSYSVYKGEGVTLICGMGLISNPKPIITWIHPQTESDAGRYVKTEDPDVTLTINNVTKNDEGIWMCTVKLESNDLSVACPDPNASTRTRYVEMNVTVIVPPSEPLNVRVLKVDEMNIQFSWNQPMETGSPVLTGYKLCYNENCDVDVVEESATVSVAHFKRNNCYNIAVYGVSKSDDKPVIGSRSEPMWIVADHPQHFTVSDVGKDWVYLTWSSLILTCGYSQWDYNITCSNGATTFSITTPETIYNVTNLLSSTKYSCTVVAFSKRNASSLSHLPRSSTPGSGTVIGVPNNHVIIARFTDELNSTVLNCTVQQGDIRTDTVWNIAGYSGVSRFIIFGDGDRPSSKLDFIYGNHMNITAELMSALDGVNVSCGSHDDPHQATFEFHIKDVPNQTVDEVVTLWEGTTDCTVEISDTSVEASNVIWKKNEKNWGNTNDGVKSVKFSEITKEDRGHYVVTFDARSHKTSPSRPFKFHFSVDVYYGPNMTEKGPEEYSVREGDNVTLICGEHLESHPEATVIWMSPWGEEIKSSDGIYTTNNLPNVTLMIENVTTDHDGRWICVVKLESSGTTCHDPDISKRKLNIYRHVAVEGAVGGGFNIRVITSLLVIVLGGVPVVYLMCVRLPPKIGKPGRPKASNIVHDSVELTWAPSTNASKVTSYAVLFRSDKDPPGQWNRQDTNKATVKVAGLSPKTTYTFKVCALCKDTMGPESEISDPITTTAVPTRPYHVLTKPHATDVTHNSVTIAWEDDDDSDLEDYTVQYRPLDSKSWKEYSVHTQSRSAIIGGLRPQTKYEFKIHTVSGVTSDTSDPILTEADVDIGVRKEPTLAESLKEHSLKISSGDSLPAVYSPTPKTVGGQIARCIITPDESEQIDSTNLADEKVLMLVGATGAGKSTLINGIVNYIMRVRWEDEFRFKVIIDEKEASQAHSQTSKITAYSFYHSTLPYTLTVIDTPGFGDTRGIERDKAIVDQIRSFFSARGPESIKQIHGIGFVIQAGSPRLTATVKYVFDSVLSVFGKDIASNIFLMLTFADGQKAPVLSAIQDAGIPYQKDFQFNNSVLYASRDDSSTVDVMFWNLGHKSFKRFFAEFEKAEPHGLELTRENLEERQHLEAVVEGLKLQIQVGTTKIDVLRQKKQILRRREADILRNEHFEYELTVTKQRLVDLPSNISVTNCKQCNFTCHYPCPIREDKEKYRCKAMDSGGKESAQCTVCPGNCPWSQHVNASQRFELYYVVETHTSDELKKNLSDAIQGKKEIEAIIGDIEKELDMLQGAIVGMVREAKRSLERLQEVALKPNPLSEIEYIDLLIKAEKTEKSPGFTERIKAFEIIKTMVKEHDSKGGKKVDSSWWKSVIDSR